MKILFKSKVCFLIFIFCVSVYAQIYSEKDVEICNSKFSFAVEKNLAGKPIGDIIAEIGKSFTGTEYVAHSLEIDGEEQLVINLSGLDCTTFLESAIVLSRLVKMNKTSFEDFQNELIKVRYREGVINQYPSRLHYFSDWIYDNEKKGIVKDVTKDMGGKPTNFKVNFMSTHPESYKHLIETPEFVPVIQKQEKEISVRSYFYIPQEKIFSVENKIQNGDLVAFTTNIKGLDISHTGIALKGENGRVHLLHAPNVGHKVQITEEPLSEYVKKIKKHTGIIILRPIEPEKL
jgi:hypothetical protein